MENASKALLMAGGVLITIVVISLGVYLMRNMAENTSHFYEIMEQSEIIEFNDRFTKYEGLDLTMQDVVSIMNLARNNNVSKELNSSDLQYIEVEGEGTLIDNISIYMTQNNSNYEENTKELIKNYNDYSMISSVDGTDKTKRIKYFNCEIEINDETLLVKKIKIKQTDNE